MKKLILMFSSLTITCSMVCSAIACSNENILDLNKITSDMIINWKDKYTAEGEYGEKMTVTPEKIANLSNKAIENIIGTNLEQIFIWKLTAIDKTLIEDPKIFDRLNNTEAENYANLGFLLATNAIFYFVTSKNKIFNVIITTFSWDLLNKDDAIKKLIINKQDKAKKFLEKSVDQQKAEISKPDMNNEQKEQALYRKVEEAKSQLKASFEQVKLMYDRIKRKKWTIDITINLTFNL